MDYEILCDLFLFFFFNCILYWQENIYFLLFLVTTEEFPNKVFVNRENAFSSLSIFLLQNLDSTIIEA